jgi:hypothetical protein
VAHRRVRVLEPTGTPGAALSCTRGRSAVRGDGRCGTGGGWPCLRPRPQEQFRPSQRLASSRFGYPTHAGSQTQHYQLFEGPPGWLAMADQRPKWSGEKVKPKQIKLLSAGIGAGALIAMGGLGVEFSDVSTAQPEPAPPGRMQPSEITTGQTSVQCEITSEETAPPAEATAPAAECAAPSEPTVPGVTPEITGTPTS